MSWHYALVAVCCAIYGFDTQLSRWASQRVSWYKIASLRYLIRGVVAAVGVVLLVTPLGETVKDPDASAARAAGADKWSIHSILAALIFVFLLVTAAGYAFTYMMQQTDTPTVLSATISVGSILMALVVGALAFGESLTTTQYVGIALSVVALPLLVVKGPDEGMSTEA